MGIIEPVNLSVDHIGESRQALFILLHGQGKRLTALGKNRGVEPQCLEGGIIGCHGILNLRISCHYRKIIRIDTYHHLLPGLSHGSFSRKSFKYCP